MMGKPSVVYDCYRYAKELGFTEAEARDLAATKSGRGQDATVLRRIARGKGLIAEATPKEAKAITAARKAMDNAPVPTPSEGKGEKHKHSYRKDGTCACGQVRRERKAKT